MGEIFVPSSLTGADAAKGILEQLEKLNDPENRKKIEADIMAAHKLNETEAKKAAEARSLIKKHQDILDETRRIYDATIKEKDDLAKEKSLFKLEMEAERLKLSVEKSTAQDAVNKAAELNKQTNSMKEDLADREALLRTNTEIQLSDVKRHTEEKLLLQKQKIDLDSYKDQILALDKQTNEKVEKLKQFNF